MRRFLVAVALTLSAGLASAAQGPQVAAPAVPGPDQNPVTAPPATDTQGPGSPAPLVPTAPIVPPETEALLKSKGVTLDNKSYIKKALIWSDPVIPVCWENPTDEDAQARQWVQDGLANTWERVSMVRFVGWPTCAPAAIGVRVRIISGGSLTEGLGTEIDARNRPCSLRSDGGPCRVLLNLRPATWPAGYCAAGAEICIKSVAVHEFGHVLAFAHEQNRPDTPDECKRRSSGDNGDVQLTPYDPASVMNYCQPNVGARVELSKYDIETVRKFYRSRG